MVAKFQPSCIRQLVMPVHANDDQEIAQATPRKRRRMSLDLRRQIVALRDKDLRDY
ncbi:hypothetical protein CAOG_009795 [Capsaspora owczarzaki ATCC 30864]|uniref:Uncharacterized protein n=1 Tax=Capsaspora owczarzaki (strain ATCC 30864) TaxID=595528 RepID=A0A0D2WQU1_CAPO3|nr:hypothetical protein CAOG_009795 [Capsaspora owczarzaki ATCC 30864]